MNCNHCGSELDAGDKFCKYCGKRIKQQEDQTNQVTEVTNKKYSRLAIAGFVLSIVSLVLLMLPIKHAVWARILCAFLGVVFSGIGLAYAKEGILKGRGLALAGLIMGIIGL